MSHLLIDPGEITCAKNASGDVARLCALVRLAGAGLRMQPDTAGGIESVGDLMEWVAVQIDRQCAVIDGSLDMARTAIMEAQE